MDSSASSKVTVEYHDPSGIFPLAYPSIALRLPLRNLNWQSPSRPLRQIKSLHLDFAPDDFTKSSLRPPTAQTPSEGANSFDFVRSGADPRARDSKERRHQIPGLQTSPYLKVYVLRCDDKDAYKARERAQIRQWLRDNATAPSSNKKNASQNENHAASEYLILHVVVPDTIAASQPRWRESQREPDELKERKQGAKWPGKSTRTVFDKLRADFNDSSKTDRVAQLRLSKDDVPADLLPTPAQAVTYDETPDEQSKTWNDLLSKLRTLILIPFDKRVRQYEQDIAEQESRRSLPGFNFCTFFIHKEGLARALEVIGLVEDALVIYDELSLGLESVLRDLASGKAEGTATTFAPYTDDVQERIVGAGQSKVNGASPSKSHIRNDSEKSVDSGEIDYRERIVRSNISVFDFHCYLFTRRKALILRLANAITARKQLGTHTKEGGEDLVLISEVCWRASNFLHNTARVLRQDLHAAKAADRAELSSADIDALVCSWLYTVAGHILDETATSALDPQPDHSRKPSLKSPPNRSVTSPRRSEFAGLGDAYPQRTTSLPARKSRASELRQNRASVQSVSEETLVSPPSSSGNDGTTPTGLLPGLPELVTYRAELVMMQRKMLEQVAVQRGWLAGWASLRAKRGRMETVDLDGDDELTADSDKPNKEETASTLLTSNLTASLLSQEVFHESYDLLSDQAMRYYMQATQSKSAEAILGDLAILKFQQGDYEFAARYFEHVLSSYREEGWTTMEAEALQVLRVCFCELGRRREEVNAALRLMEIRVESEKNRQADMTVVGEGSSMNEVVTLSEVLEKEVAVPAANYFADLAIEEEIVHFDDHDGFALNLHLRHPLEENLELDEVIARLAHSDDPSQELLLQSTDASTLRQGRNAIQLRSNVTAFGPYLIDNVVLKAKNVHFTHDFQPPKAEPETTSLGAAAPAPSRLLDSPRVFVYPPQHAFSADISLGRQVHIDKPRRLEIRLSSGWNEIENLDLRLKPASAGLRLHLGDASLDGIQRQEGAEAKPGVLPLGTFSSQEEALIKLPYSLDYPNTPSISLHLNAQYHTPNGPFTFAASAKLTTELPLDVDVNDIFHNDALFSNFTIRGTSKRPLFVSSAELRSSGVYDVQAPPGMGGMAVFEQQPGRVVYKITRKEGRGARGERVARKDASLAFDVRYVVLDDHIAQTVRAALARALDEGPFASLRRLLCSLVGMRVTQVLSNTDVEMATLLGEARVPSYEIMGWAEVVGTLPTAIQAELEAWLKNWHTENSSIALDLEGVGEKQQRSITIAVEVPTMDFVHKATFTLTGSLHQSSTHEQVLALGQPVNAELDIASTTDWSEKSIFGPSGESADRTQSFVYDIHADPDTWLIGGPRRGHFDAGDGLQAKVAVTVIPLRLGSYALPVVDVLPSRSAPATDSSNDGENEGTEVTSETHYASAGEVVRVIRDLRRSRVHIPEANGADGDDGAQGRPGSARTVTSAIPPGGRPGSASRPGTAGTVKEVG